MSAPVNRAGTIKRRRATQDEMQAREDFLISYACRHGPVTVRGLYYQAEVAGLPGIDKSENGYRKVQAQVLALRQQGRLAYDRVSDETRLMRKPRTYDGWEAALENTARLYRKALWAETDVQLEIWIEKSALAGVVYPVTAEYDVPLMCTGGFASETFVHGAVEQLRGTGRRLVVLSLYDFDRAGQDAARSVRDKIRRFGTAYDVDVAFQSLGLSHAQVQALDLPTRPPKRATPADRRWPHDIAAELDAIPPNTLRGMIREAIEDHLPRGELDRLKMIEAAERQTLMTFIGRTN